MTVKTQKTVEILAQYIWGGGGWPPKPLIPAAYDRETATDRRYTVNCESATVTSTVG